MKVIKQSRIFKEGILVDKAEIKSKNKKFNRYRVDRPDAVAVIVHNKKEKTITMVKQFRYAIHDRFKGNLLEIPAGKIDKGEQPIKTAVRETYEECGYKLKANFGGPLAPEHVQEVEDMIPDTIELSQISVETTS